MFQILCYYIKGELKCVLNEMVFLMNFSWSCGAWSHFRNKRCTFLYFRFEKKNSVFKWKSKLFKAHILFISVSSEKIMQFGPAVIEIFWPGTPKMTFWEKCIKYHIFYSKTNFLSLRMHLLHKTYTYTLQHVHYSTAWNDYFKFTSRGGSRTAATSKVKHLMIIVNRLKPLTIIAKTFILVLAAVLDPPLSWANV